MRVSNQFFGMVNPLQNSPNYKWYLLVLAALTGCFAIGVPTVSLAVLFEEISADLHLNLVQMGLVWSIGALPAIVTSPLSGAVIDRFGPRRVMIAGTFLLALTAGLRGTATGFASLLAVIFVVGGLVPLVIMSSYKICGLWFSRRQLGLANGVLSMGMALGLLLGSLLSATMLSPWLGGWRKVLFFYGGLAALFCLPWFFARVVPEGGVPGAPQTAVASMREALAHILKSKALWLFGFTMLGISGCLQGLSGYLPLYLRGQGWPDAHADAALSLFNAVSMVFILPVAAWSDRMGVRKWPLLGMLALILAGTGVLSFVRGAAVWLAVILAGMLKDGSTTLLLTMTIESDGVGPVYAGTATGFVMFFFFVGNLLSPPLGNKLADVHPGLPFVFWAALVGLGISSLAFARSVRHDPQTQLQSPS